MPGSPIRRARREAEKREAELRQSDPERWAAEQMLRQQQQEAEQQQSTGDQSTLAPLSSTASRARSVRDLYAQMLSGAESALAQLHAGMAAGLDARELKELSVTANVLMRAAKLIEDDKPVEEPPSLAELEAAEAEAERLLAERRGRG